MSKIQDTTEAVATVLSSQLVGGRLLHESQTLNAAKLAIQVDRQVLSEAGYVIVSKDKLLVLIETHIATVDAEFGETRSAKDASLREEFRELFEQFGLENKVSK